jgi:excisionase family DNA binding protein
MEERKFLDVQLLANYIHVSKSLIYKMVRNKTIPHHKIGSRTLFDKDQIDEWVMNDGMIVKDLPEVPQFKLTEKDPPIIERSKPYFNGKISLRA